MKRTMMMALGLAVAVTACGKKDEGKQPAKTPPTTAPKKVVTTQPAKTAADPTKMTMPDVKPGPKGDPAGLVMVTSKLSFDASVKALKAALKGAGMAIVFEANHKNMMKMVGLESRSSVTVGFGNPKSGNMFMSKDPRLALVMPMHMTVRELDDGSVAVLYYKPSYLFGAFGKAPLVAMAKKKPEMMMAKFASAASGTKVKPAPGPTAPTDALVSVVSKNDFDKTVAKLKAAIKMHGLATVFEANHQNMMKMVGIESKKSVLIGFAKPQVAAKLLKLEPRAALEMPMQVAVRELDDGSIVALYFAPSFLMSHYGKPKLRMMAEKKLDKMVAMLVAMATK